LNKKSSGFSKISSFPSCQCSNEKEITNSYSSSNKIQYTSAIQVETLSSVPDSSKKNYAPNKIVKKSTKFSTSESSLSTSLSLRKTLAAKSIIAAQEGLC
jgi:hypothetical protein